MAFFRGPSFVLDGLVLYLDAANPDSYPGSGTSWLNIYGSENNGTLTNGPTFNSDSYGNIQFDGLDDYAIVNLTNQYSNYTINFFCKWNSTEGFGRIFGSTGQSTYTIRNYLDVNFHYNSISNPSSSISLFSGVNVGINNWCCVTVTVDSLINSVKIYINGVFKNSNNDIPSQNLRTNIYLGGQSPTILSASQFGYISIYNRALSAGEILQNYNSTKTRFGLS